MMYNKFYFIDQKIKSLLELPKQWDGEHAERVTDIAAGTATLIAYFVSGCRVDLVQFFPTVTGGIQLDWFIDGNELEIEIDKDGNFLIVSVDKNGSKIYEQEFNSIDATVFYQIRQQVNRLSIV